MSERPRALHVLLLLPLLAVAVWVWQRGKETSPGRTAVLAALRASRGPSLPAAPAAGATTRTEPARYSRDTLYEAIDGAADAYLAGGFVSAEIATYSYTTADAPLCEITAELHRFGTGAGASAQRDAERPRSVRTLADLPGAESDGAVLLAVKGSHYLKLTSLSQAPGAEKRLAALAHACLEGGTR